jgi:hypothetical protein
MTEQKETRFVNFRTTVHPGIAVLLLEPSPLTGEITHVLFHFPAGCNALVMVRVLLNHEPVWPIRENFLALDDSSPLYEVSEVVKKFDPLEVEIWNTDDTYDHTVTVELTLKGQL